MSKPRILIADDHQILAEGLRGLLEPEFEIVGVVADGRELVAAATSAHISVPIRRGLGSAKCLISESNRHAYAMARGGSDQRQYRYRGKAR